MLIFKAQGYIQRHQLRLEDNSEFQRYTFVSSDKQELPQRTSSTQVQVDQVTRSMLRKIVSLQVRSKYDSYLLEYFNNKQRQRGFKLRYMYGDKGQERHPQHWKRLGRLYFVAFVLVRDIFFKNCLTYKETSGINVDLKLIQEEDPQHSVNTSEQHDEVIHNDVEPHSEIVPIHRSNKIPQAPDQMDVKTAFLNGYLSEDHLEAGIRDLIRKLKKVGFTQNPDDPCVYLKASGSNVALLVLYVDDMSLIGNNNLMLQDVKSWLGKCFSMKDLGEAAYILGIKITSDISKRLISLSQSAYFDKILKEFKMAKSKRGNILMQEKPKLSKAQGSIMYVYLRNTKDMVLVYGGNRGNELRVTCYIDIGFHTDRDDTKSQSGYVFLLNGGAMDWKSAKQSTIEMSSTKAEYIATSEALVEAVWISKFIDGLGSIVSTNKEPMDMLCNNTSAIAIANDPRIMKGAKHYQKKYHYIREVIENGNSILNKVHTNDNVDDPFMKPMPLTKHNEHAMGIGVRRASSLM
ncbi:retrotransposon protein, putative, ty1-copia subclass [Tanacetum coccineum]